MDFTRSFNVAALEEWDAKHCGNVVRFLFKQWAMPGSPSTAEASLRLAVRNGYVNFYVKGQSVAKLSLERSRPKLTVHRAYVENRARRSGDAEAEPPARGYLVYDADALAKAETAALISGWIATAESYASAEKRFVDRLVEANAGVIDLEMGLPAGDAPEGKRIAPRMDLVIAQMLPGEPASIVFWEAKCSINGELRGKEGYVEKVNGEYKVGPKVIHQLRKYQRWMREGDRLTEVQRAYKAAAGIMLGFYKVFGNHNAPKPECIGIWEKLAASSGAEVILPPGVVIGNYCPTGHEPNKPDEFERYGASFGAHRDKLRSHGIPIHEVGLDLADHVLPPLSAGMVSA